MHDLIIIGGGPAGVAAGVYAARKKIKVALVAETFGGQSLVSADVQNWIGTKSVSGLDLAKMLEEHLRAQSDIEIVDGMHRLAKAVLEKRKTIKVYVFEPATSDGTGLIYEEEEEEEPVYGIREISENHVRLVGIGCNGAHLRVFPGNEKFFVREIKGLEKMANLFIDSCYISENMKVPRKIVYISP